MILLPEKPAPTTCTPAYVDYGRVISGPLGGTDQRLDRPGSRWRLGNEMPAMRSSDDARVYVARLVQGKSEVCRMEWPLGDFEPGNPGEPETSTHEPSGEILPLTGFAPHYIIKEGQFFSIEYDGQHFMHMVKNIDGVVADADGNAQLNVIPEIKRPMAAGARCHFAKPMIEGYVQSGDEMQWQLAVDHNVGLEFSIQEVE